MKILVTGASGFIGGYLVRALLAKGHTVRAFVRRERSLTSSKRLQVFVGDMRDERSLMDACKGMDAVYHLAASTSEKATGSQESKETNVDGARYLVAACQAAKIKHLIVVSTQSTKRKKRGDYGETKRQADEIFLKSDLPVTILKPTLVYGQGGKGIFIKIAGLVSGLPIIPIIGSGTYKVQWIYVEDLVQAMLAALMNKKAMGKTYDLAGKTRMTFVALIEAMLKAMGQRKRRIHVPFWLCYKGAQALSLVTKNPPITTDNLLGLIQETNVDLAPARADLGFDPLPFMVGIERTLWGNDDDTSLKHIGIIGLGKMGLLHASIIKGMSDARVARLYDVNKKAKTSLYGANIKARFTTDLDEFLARPLDAVIVSVPPAFTLPIARKCAAKRVNMLIEKPLANSLAHAKEIEALAKSHNLVVSVGYMYAYRPLIQEAKRVLDSGALGTLVSGKGHAYVTQVLKKKKGWRYAKSTSGGGCLTIHGTHLLSIIHLLLGHPQKIVSKLHHPFSEVEDRCEARLTFGEADVSIDCDWSKPGYPKLDVELTLIGTNGTLTLREDALLLDLKRKHTAYAKGKTIIEHAAINHEPFELGGSGYYAQDRAFVDALQGKSKPRITATEGVAIQRLLEEIYQSS